MAHHTMSQGRINTLKSGFYINVFIYKQFPSLDRKHTDNIRIFHRI